MARIRTIKPDFFIDEDIAEMPPLCRIVFQGLWCQSDREGRLEDRPKRLKAQVMPHDDVDMNEVLDTIEKHGFIVRYEVGGRRLIQVRTFGKHQYPNKKEPPSTIPAPCQHETGFVPTCEGTSGMDLGNGSGEGKGSPSPADDGAFDESFDRFWDAYPRKDAKQAAEKAWRKLKPKPELVEAIVVAVTRQAKNWRDPQFIPLPASWLNGERWKDQGPKVRDGPMVVSGWRDTCRVRGHEEPCGTPQKCDLLHERTQRRTA
jgi:hypothetical protein